MYKENGNLIKMSYLKSFNYVAKYGTLSKAAKELGITVPALSTSITTLENITGKKLFDRKPEGMKLTQMGEQLYRTTAPAFESIEKSEKILLDKNELVIGCQSHLAIFYLMDKIEKAKKDDSELVVKLNGCSSTAEMIKLIKENKLNFAIIDVIPEENTKGLTIEKVGRINNILVANEPLEIKNSKDMEGLNYILNFDYTITTKTLQETLAKYDINIEPSMVFDITELRVDAVKRGLGVGYIMKEAVKKQLDNGELYELKLPEDIKLPETQINIVYKDNSLTDVDKKFIRKYIK